MTTFVFLDDERSPSDAYWMNYNHQATDVWIVVRTYKQFKAVVEAYKNFDSFVFSFDHDIQDFVGGKEYTGKDCLNFLCCYCLGYGVKIPECLFHSKNPIGVDNMKCLYQNALVVENL